MDQYKLSGPKKSFILGPLGHFEPKIKVKKLLISANLCIHWFVPLAHLTPPYLRSHSPVTSALKEEKMLLALTAPSL